MTRLAVLSDIHGNLTALEAALADLGNVGEVDHIWVLGDLAAFGARPMECIRRVRELKAAHEENKVRIIGGNTDRYLVTGERVKLPPAADDAAFSRLAATRRTVDNMLNWNLEQLSWEDYSFLAEILHKETALNVPGYGTVIGYHAIPGDDEFVVSPDTPDHIAADAMLDREGRMGVGGHTHRQMDRQVDGWRLVNVGSVGLSFDQPGKFQWGLITFEGSSVNVDLHAVAYDTNVAARDLHDTGHPAPEWVISRLQG